MASDANRVGIDDVVAAATEGVLRAFAARDIDAPEFTSRGGFFVKVDVTAGAWPGPVETNPFGGEVPGTSR